MAPPPQQEKYNVHHLDIETLIELRDILQYRLNVVLEEIEMRQGEGA